MFVQIAATLVTPARSLRAGAAALVMLTSGLAAPLAAQTRGSSAAPGHSVDGVTVVQPGPPQPTIRQHGARPCVLLRNDNVLFGQAQQLGELIIVRTGPHDQLKLPRSEVACWANSVADLYQYRLDHHRPSDLSAHLAEARWCLRYELFTQARQQIDAAKAIAPNHRLVGQLEDQWRRSTAAGPPSTVDPPAVAVANYHESAPADQRDAANHVDPWLLSRFATTVQPVLINRCGRCHDRDGGTAWKLAIPAEGSRPTARATRDNLAATLAFIDVRQPAESELLIKATTEHGGGKAALTLRNAKALDALKRWIHQWSQSAGGPDTGQVRYDEDQDATATGEIEPAAYVTNHESAANDDQPATATVDLPQRLPTVANPFDPQLFNRRFHHID